MTLSVQMRRQMIYQEREFDKMYKVLLTNLLLIPRKPSRWQKEGVNLNLN